MSGCDHCGGGCKHCAGCGVLELNEGEIAMLQKLGQIPFLPVARRADSMQPIYPDDEICALEESSLILQCLEKKGLISIDYDAPLKGFSSILYHSYPIRGSFALTSRGQQALELLEIQGIDS